MGLTPLKIPPGIFRNGTNYQSLGRWYDGNLMRWYSNTLRPFGGWVRLSDTNLGGSGRGLLTWRPSSFARNAAVGTPNKLQVWDDDDIYDITPAGFPAGVESTFYGVGYGFGPYGSGPYGTSTGSGATEATTWALDTWGDYLVAVASHDRVLYEWQNDTGVDAVAVANAPSMLTMFVTEERILIAVGADGDLRKVQWCDQEDNTQWTPAANNQAGDLPVQTAGTLVRGAVVTGANLLWTTVGVHKMSYLGPPYVYSIERVSDNCGLAAPLALQVFEGGAVWLGQKNFFRYSGGSVGIIPCDIHDYVFGDINFDQSAKFSSGYIAAFGEVLFFYCSAGSTTIDRCVSYNEREGHWNIVGDMPRGCWADVGAFRFPLAVGEDGILYQQETGWTADGDPILTDRFALSGPVQFGAGDRIMEGVQLIPDEKTGGSAQIRFAQKFTPEGPVYDRGPYPTAEYTDIRITGRQVAMKVESTVDDDFRIGDIRLEATPGGMR